MFDDDALSRLREILSQRPAIQIEAPQHRRASVLVPFIRGDDGWSLILTRRSENLASHSGQIAFPGGAVEGDESLEAAAVREAEEEVGIAASSVELIGRLDDLVTHSGFLVAPFVGVIHERPSYVMQETEVTEIFEVPLAVLLDRRNPEIRWVPFRNRQFPAYFYRHEAYEIWGLTGRMIKSLLDLVWQAT
jgi:8-oxo-dGTP pyrophosphatase MutT (NUDIX family)